MLEFTRTIKVAGVLTNATSATIGIIRTDTSAAVVASGTAMTHDSTGRYSYTLSSEVAGVTYRATYVTVLDGNTYTSSQDKVAGIADAAWVYSTQQDVEDLIGAESLRLISNAPGVASDAATDSARVQRVGELVDAEINARLSAAGWVTPLANMDDDTTSLMKQVSAKMVVYKLNEPRMLTSLSSGRTANAIDRVMGEHRKVSMSMLNGIVWGITAIVADRKYTRQPYAKVYVPTLLGRFICR